jgi:DNA-binding response OmpR family regulator
MKDAMRNQTPVIVLTAEVGDELNQVMSNPCVMDYVRKPLSPTALRVAAMQVLSLSAKT